MERAGGILRLRPIDVERAAGTVTQVDSTTPTGNQRWAGCSPTSETGLMNCHYGLFEFPIGPCCPHFSLTKSIPSGGAHTHSVRVQFQYSREQKISDLGSLPETLMSLLSLAWHFLGVYEKCTTLSPIPDLSESSSQVICVHFKDGWALICTIFLMKWTNWSPVTRNKYEAYTQIVR